MSSVTLPNGKRFTDPAALQQYLKENPRTSTPERGESVVFLGPLGRAGETPECVGHGHSELEAAVAKAMALVTHQWVGQTPVTPGQSRPVTPSGAFHSPLLSRPQTPLALSRGGTPSRSVSALMLGSTDPVLWQSPTTPGPDVPPSPSRAGYVPTSPFAYGAGADAWSPSSPMQTMRPSPRPTSPFAYPADADPWSRSSPVRPSPPHYAPKTPHMPHSVTATVEPWAGLPQHEVSHIVSREPSPEPVVFTQPPLTDELIKSLGTYPDEQRHAPQRRSARLAKRK